jgi:small-conductance mechanosensitive channel
VNSLDSSLIHGIVASALLFAAIGIARLIAVRALDRSGLAIDVKQRWLNQIRGGFLFVLIVCLIVIWTEELRGALLSIAAFAVAFVISLKEVLLCFHGAFVRTSSRAFAVGDRIQVGPLRGDVVETGALTTRLLEVGVSGSKQTGRAIVVPNSLFVSEPIFNDATRGEFALHSFAVPVAQGEWMDAERRLLKAAREVCSAFVEPARRFIEDEAWKVGLGPDSIGPVTSLAIDEPETVKIRVRFPVPARQGGRFEQLILRRFLEMGTDTPVATEEAIE